METLWQDVRFAFRAMLKYRGVTLVAVLTLALGIGATTGLFSLLDAVLLKPLPFREPERLTMVWERNFKRNRPRNVVGPSNFVHWRERARSFEQMAAFATIAVNVGGEGEPERVQAGVVAPELFSTLGVEAALGRTLQPADGREGAERVILLSHGFWQRRYGGETSLMGKPLTVNGVPRQVVGIMPPNFSVPPQAELWIPLVFTQESRTESGRWMAVVARLKPGISLSQAQAEMDLIAKQRVEEWPEFNTGWGVNLVPLREQLLGDVRGGLLVLFGAVGLVLLIACANVANLLLARAVTREREMAVRAALGARRLRLVRQLLTESLLLGILGGAAGLAVAQLTLRGLLAVVPTELPRFIEVGLHPGVLGFALGLSLLTGILFGLAPAVTVSRTDLNASLKEGSRGTGGVGRQRLRSVLVVSEIALAMVLLIGAGLLLKSFARLSSVEPGFRPEGLLTAQVSLTPAKYREEHQQAYFFGQLLERVERIPGVEHAAAMSWLPMERGGGSATTFIVLDRPEPPPGEKPVGDIRVVTPGLFRTLGIPVRQGRDFSAQDTAEAPRVVVINEAMAREFWPEESPLGKRIAMDWGEPIEAEIVGVVGDVHLLALDTRPRATLYWQETQLTYSAMTLFVRASGDPSKLGPAIRSQLAGLDPDQPLADVQTMDAVLEDSLKRPRFTTLLLGAFAAVALLLAAIGIYGIISQSVGQRTHEIGLRMALGARPADIFRLVLGEGMQLTLAGTGLGVAGALVATRALASLLFDVKPTDSLTFFSVPLLLVLVALAASYLPARRATRVAPMTALRYE